MNQRIYNLSKWARVGDGKGMPFPAAKRRNVVLEINTADPVSLYVFQNREDLASNPEKRNDYEAGRPSRISLPDMVDVDPLLAGVWDERKKDNELKDLVATFLCYCSPGRDTIDFAVDGPFWLVPDGGEIYVYSQDSQQHEVHIDAPEVFTRIANRKARNPQLELMMWAQRQNMEVRFAALAADAERRIIAAEEGAKAKYAPPRQSRSPFAGRYVQPVGTEGEGEPEVSAGTHVREERPDREEGETRSRVPGKSDVPSGTKDARGKVKSPS